MNLQHPPDIDKLVKKWRLVLDATRHIGTFTTDRELAWIADYATWCSNYLEIGSWRGRSAKVALMANPGLKITCLDTWDDPGTYEEFLHNLGPEIHDKRVTIVRGHSQQSLLTLPIDQKRDGHFLGFDGCFIDGGHEEHLVAADIKNARVVMKPKSVMAGHDYSSDGGPNDVARGVLSLGYAIQRPVDSIWAVQL